MIGKKSSASESSLPVSNKVIKKPKLEQFSIQVSSSSVSLGESTVESRKSSCESTSSSHGYGGVSPALRSDGKRLVEKNSLIETELIEAKKKARSARRDKMTEDDKRDERRASNRLSAFQSRQRRKIIIEDLQKTVSQLSKDNAEQKTQMEILKQENECLRGQLQASTEALVRRSTSAAERQDRFQDGTSNGFVNSTSIESAAGSSYHDARNAVLLVELAKMIKMQHDQLLSPGGNLIAAAAPCSHPAQRLLPFNAPPSPPTGGLQESIPSGRLPGQQIAFLQELLRWKNTA